MRDKLLLGPDTTNPKLTTIMQKIENLESVVLPPVYFPDLFLKERTESPSSFAAATNNVIVPELSAPSLGCGMGVIKTDLTEEDLTEDFLETFYKNLQEHLGKNYNFFENVSVWIGLRTRKTLKYDLTSDELVDVIKHGAEAAVKKYGYGEQLLANIEDRGSVYTEGELKDLDLHKILPRSSFTNGRHDLGYGYKGNHFLEFQLVEDVLNEEMAQKMGLSKNQIVIMYHGGGGMIPYHVGRYYANRKKNTLKQKMFLFIGKSIFHFACLDGLKNFKERLTYYFLPKPFQEIPLESFEGKRLMLANKAALNYSYAFNIAILRRIEDAMIKTKSGSSVELITAKIHNMVSKENIEGKDVLVHRHTANKLVPGKANLISGFNNTNSYIVTAGDAASSYLNSADHGAGSVIKRFVENGTSKKYPNGYKTNIYTTKTPFKKQVEHITSEGIDYVIHELERVKVIDPVIKLRPVAVFKG